MQILEVIKFGTVNQLRSANSMYLAKKKEVWMAFVDIEQAFDRDPREDVWWTLRELVVDEWIMSVIKAMHEDVTTVVKINGRVSRYFHEKVGVHQVSVLSHLLLFN